MKMLKIKLVVMLISMIAFYTSAQQTSDQGCGSILPKTHPLGNPECPGYDQIYCCEYMDNNMTLHVFYRQLL